METVFATPDGIPAIKAIWLDAFPTDTDGDVTAFLTRAFAPDRCLMMLENGQPVSMVFMLPATLESAKDQGMKQPFRLQYIYAAATLTAFRGRGIFGNLLQKAQEHARAEGIQASFLRPAEPSLFTYYERFGYRPFFVTETERSPRDEFLKKARPGRENNRNTADPTPVDGPVATTRDQLLKGHPAWVRWPEFLVEYAAASARKNNGGLVAVNGGWALCEPVRNTVWIREWLCEPHAEAALRYAVDRYFQADEIILRRPAPVSGAGNRSGEPFGMLCPLTEEAKNCLCGLEKQNPYMGLAFD